MLARRLFVLLLAFLLIITFLITRAYYLLLLIVLLFSLIVISVFCMLMMYRKISFQFLQSENEMNLVFRGKGFFPVGRIKIEIVINNLFLDTSLSQSKQFLVCGGSVYIPLDESLFHLGKSVISIKSCRIIDMLGIFSKKIRCQEKMESFCYPYIDESYRKLNAQVNEKLRNYNQQKNEDYDIREYREGDSVKDIHYKVSYRQSKLMIKDKYKDAGLMMKLFLDLSGDEEDCRQVLSYLYQFVCHLTIQKSKCQVQWYSKNKLMEEKISDLKEYEEALHTILSNPKADGEDFVHAEWVITKMGIEGGE
ncbi:DUF58 domain-containing protein [uncultured Traorella sp.]|uniref:DUF58 domain-containing protein n=1 Tax=uncultured Traorella sp. TaxID=1929048 RepID=UPI0025E11743|nr:DUF58 domain-containing protein [uncultured Traorella sp.]